ncbi:MAG: competence/damage-inducible protein A [Fidelibacterota bacterium]
MIAEIITIGDEILLGRTLDSNSAYIARQLTSLGVHVRWITSVGDDRDQIIEVLKGSSERADIILITGGLGPTHDDITKKCMAEYFNSKLIYRDEIFQKIRRMFAERGIKMPRINREQAVLPHNAEIIENTRGSAQGMIFRKKGKLYFVMPGVPHEMQGMMENRVIPYIKQNFKTEFIYSRTFKTTGIAESALMEKFTPYIDGLKGIKFAYLPKYTGVDIRITASGTDEDEVIDNLNKAQKLIDEVAGDYIYSRGGKQIEEILGELLLKHNLTIAVAESCTGGLISNRITNISGSSRYFEMGVITYSNTSKINQLNVPEELIKRYGAVSSQVAESMARGVMEKGETDIGISATGIAGPLGGSPEKPVGLVYIGYADSNESLWERHIFSKDRLLNKERTAQAALDLARRMIIKKYGR